MLGDLNMNKKSIDQLWLFCKIYSYVNDRYVKRFLIVEINNL